VESWWWSYIYIFVCVWMRMEYANS
jgi:hypothetical protein